MESLLNTSSGEKGQSSNKEEGYEKSVLDDIELSIDDEDDVGEVIAEKLAGITNKAFSKHLSLRVYSIKSKQSSHKRPKNCDKVFVPRVNKEIWRQMQKQAFTKKRDLRIMNLQNAVNKTTFAILRVADSLLKNKKDNNVDSELRNCMDAVFLLGHANTSMSLRGRELLKPILRNDFSALCDGNVPVTALLFGDDLAKALKEARQVGNVRKKISVKKRETILESPEERFRLEEPEQRGHKSPKEIQESIGSFEKTECKPLSEVSFELKT